VTQLNASLKPSTASLSCRFLYFPLPSFTFLYLPSLLLSGDRLLQEYSAERHINYIYLHIDRLLPVLFFTCYVKQIKIASLPMWINVSRLSPPALRQNDERRDEREDFNERNISTISRIYLKCKFRTFPNPTSRLRQSPQPPASQTWRGVSGPSSQRGPGGLRRGLSSFY